MGNRAERSAVVGLGMRRGVWSGPAWDLCLRSAWCEKGGWLWRVGGRRGGERGGITPWERRVEEAGVGVGVTGVGANEVG